MSWLICLAGAIASGKTTLADALTVALPEATRFAFGDAVRRRAQVTYAHPTREQLQETGLQLIREGWPVFVNELLAGAEFDSDIVIVEGVRHLEAIDELRARLPEHRLLLVYVEVADDQRRARLAQRSELAHVLNHAVERDVVSLRAVADVVVHSDQPIEDLVGIVSRYVDRRRDADELP